MDFSGIKKGKPTTIQILCKTNKGLERITKVFLFSFFSEGRWLLFLRRHAMINELKLIQQDKDDEMIDLEVNVPLRTISKSRKCIHQGLG